MECLRSRGTFGWQVIFPVRERANERCCPTCPTPPHHILLGSTPSISGEGQLQHEPTLLLGPFAHLCLHINSSVCLPLGQTIHTYVSRVAKPVAVSDTSNSQVVSVTVQPMKLILSRPAGSCQRETLEQ